MGTNPVAYYAMSHLFVSPQIDVSEMGTNSDCYQQIKKKLLALYIYTSKYGGFNFGPLHFGSWAKDRDINACV